MRFASLGSGSAGNALLVEAASGTTTTRVLLDCGFSIREATLRAARLAVDLASLDAIIVTHEHTDHIGSALALARKYSIPVVMSWGTAQAVKAHEANVELRLCASDQAFEVGDLQCMPYTVPHDAREPLQFVFSNGGRRLGVLTDSGSGTSHITAVLAACQALVLECNHDRAMLANGRYPVSLKARVGGSHGHLSNDTAAQILRGLDRRYLQRIVAAHLSAQNNLPELAQQALADVLGTEPAEIHIATQDQGFDWLPV